MLMGIVVAIAAAVVLVALYLAFVSWRIARRAEAAVPPPGAFVTIDGDRIHYVEEGRGRPVVMIHGLGGTLFNFTYPLHPLLKDEFRLISIDRPGSGYSTRSGDGPASPSEQAAFMVRSSTRSGSTGHLSSATRWAAPSRSPWRSIIRTRFQAWRCWRR